MDSQPLNSPQINSNQGAVLFISLILLFLLSIITLSALETTLLSDKIVQRYQENQTTFEAAQAAQVEAQAWIEQLTVDDLSDPPPGLYLTGTLPDILLPSTWQGTLTKILNLGAFPGMTPRYLVEIVQTLDNNSLSKNVYTYGQGPESGQVTVFRIVTRATGPGGKGEALMQSFYARMF